MRSPPSAPAALIDPLPGQPWPLGATRLRGEDGGYILNFAVFSAHALGMTLCLYDGEGRVERARLPLHRRTDEVWHGALSEDQLRALGLDPADLSYGWRASGPHDLARGHRFNPSKLLIDPYARRFSGTFTWTDAHQDNPTDNAAFTLKARVRETPSFDWGDDQPPRTPLADTVLYEAHTKGLTAAHPDVTPVLRGTYGGLASPAVLDHLRGLGVTALCLLPVQQHLSERPLLARGLVNYWGYNTIGFFAPDARYAAAGQDPVTAFQEMVRALHQAGLELILDVVYNHSPEGDHTGPILSLRGLDNLSYYRMRAGHPGEHENLSGCGNSLDVSHPATLRLVMDSLRYWVTELRVDGFRFDLAPTLARGPVEAGGAFDPRGAFLSCLRQDPVLAGVKLIAEPWDLGPGGYQVGGFPSRFSAWNDRFRDTTRRYWLGHGAARGEVAARVAGSSDLFGALHRGPLASVNYVSAHDGFTLRDLVSYERKHNHANGEHNRDGHDHNLSTSCGVEGDTEIPAVLALRARLARALLATVFVSRGVPMLLAGDELGRTQRGNNNAYCQDGPLTWVDWAGADHGLIGFVRRLTALRRQLPQLRGATWLSGAWLASGERDAVWLNERGEEMSQPGWREPGVQRLGLLLGASAPGERTLLLLLNPESRPWRCALPTGDPEGGAWRVLLDSATEDGAPTGEGTAAPGERLELQPHSLLLLERADPRQKTAEMP